MESITIDQMPVGENHVTKKAVQFVRLSRLHERLVAPGNHPPGFFEIEQERTEAIAMLFVGAVINGKPSLRSFYRRAPRANTYAVPHTRSGFGNALVMSPMNTIRRFSNPYVVPSKF